MKEEQKQLSFLFYTSWKEQIDELDDQELRRFINNLINYHNDQEIDLPTRTEMFLWRGILPALQKNRSRWESRQIAASENGKRGGAPKGNDNARKQPKTTQNNPMGFLETQNNLKQPKQGVNSKVLNVNSQMSNVNSQMSIEKSEVSRSNSILDNITGANNLQGNRTWNSYLNSETEGQKTSMICWINSIAKKNPQGKTKEEIATFNECKQIVELVPELFV